MKRDNSLYSLTAAEMDSIANAVKSRHATQSAQVKAMQVPAPELPGDYGCAGSCLHPPPPPPAGALNQPTSEAFMDIPQHMLTYWFVLSIATVAFLGLTLRG